jgi:hypothetical protein
LAQPEKGTVDASMGDGARRSMTPYTQPSLQDGTRNRDYGFYVHHTHLYALALLVALIAVVLAFSMASHKPAPAPNENTPTNTLRVQGP